MKEFRLVRVFIIYFGSLCRISDLDVFRWRKTPASRDRGQTWVLQVQCGVVLDADVDVSLLGGHLGEGAGVGGGWKPHQVHHHPHHHGQGGPPLGRQGAPQLWIVSGTV